MQTGPSATERERQRQLGLADGGLRWINDSGNLVAASGERSRLVFIIAVNQSNMDQLQPYFIGWQAASIEGDGFMRRKFLLVAASVAATVGVGLSVAPPASAVAYDTYLSESACKNAKPAKERDLGIQLYCVNGLGELEGLWLLQDAPGGG